MSDDEFVVVPDSVVRTSCAAPATPCRTGPPSGAAGCRPPSRSCSTRSSPRTTRPGWCWRSCRSTTPRRRCSHAGTDEQRDRHLPAILDGEIWCQGFSEPDAGSDLASLSTSARQVDGGYLVNGQKVWASGAAHADWCLLLARTDPDAPKRHGISYFLMDMRTPGIDVRPIRQATGESHFCEMFLDDVLIPERQLVGAENAGWQVAQATLGAERGMTMLELAERLGNAGFGWLVEACERPGRDGTRPIDDPVVPGPAGRRSRPRSPGSASLCRDLVDRVEAGDDGPADASIVKLYYSELLQRMTDFGAEVVGLAGHTVLREADLERLGVGRLGARLHRARGSGRSPAARARSSGRSSASGASACPREPVGDAE